jgi:hypothetical protein
VRIDLCLENLVSFEKGAYFLYQIITRDEMLAHYTTPVKKVDSVV